MKEKDFYGVVSAIAQFIEKADSEQNREDNPVEVDIGHPYQNQKG